MQQGSRSYFNFFCDVICLEVNLSMRAEKFFAVVPGDGERWKVAAFATLVLYPVMFQTDLTFMSSSFWKFEVSVSASNLM